MRLRLVKYLLAAALSLAFISKAEDSDAQARGVGARIGYGYDALFQGYGFNSPSSYYELSTGVDIVGDGGFRLALTYNWPIATSSWTSKGTWRWYLGPGVASGYLCGHQGGSNVDLMFAFVVQLTLEWQLSNHFALSADARPMYGYHFGDGDIYKGGFYGFLPSFGVKYLF